MGIYQTDSQRLENTRLILELVENRNERLATYIQATNGAILGFLGIAAIELFKNGICIPKLPSFLILVIISMLLWRYQIHQYQKSIAEGYYKIIKCQYDLDIQDSYSLRDKLESAIKRNPFIRNKSRYLGCLEFFLINGKYCDKNHCLLDLIAFLIVVISLVGLFLPHLFQVLGIPVTCH